MEDWSDRMIALGVQKDGPGLMHHLPENSAKVRLDEFEKSLFGPDVSGGRHRQIFPPRVKFGFQGKSSTILPTTTAEGQLSALPEDIADSREAFSVIKRSWESCPVEPLRFHLLKNPHPKSEFEQLIYDGSDWAGKVPIQDFAFLYKYIGDSRRYTRRYGHISMHPVECFLMPRLAYMPVSMVSDDRTTLMYLVKYHEPTVGGGKSQNATFPGFLAERQSAPIRVGESNIWVTEKVAVVAINDYKPDRLRIMVIGEKLEGEGTWYNDNRFRQYGLLGSDDRGFGRQAHHLQFLGMVIEYFLIALNAWESCLEEIDQFAQIDLEDVSDDDKIENVMFDASFARSKNYFTALQMLRIIKDSIKKGAHTLEKVRPPDYKDDGPPGVYWTRASAFMISQAKPLQERTASKIEEIQGLRDALFSANSLREATTGTTLNRGVWVFTIVTVIFTPISFLATLWALPFLNETAKEGEKAPVPPAFRGSFIGLTAGTYILTALGAYCMFLWPKQRQWPRRARNAVSGVQQRVAQAKRPDEKQRSDEIEMSDNLSSGV